jgi:NitT/TauT family transport system substrate-binding protein
MKIKAKAQGKADSQVVALRWRAQVARPGLTRRQVLGGVAVASVGHGVFAQGVFSPIAARNIAHKLEKHQFTIAVANKAALPYLPLTVAERLGYFQAEGLELNVLEAPSLVRAQQWAHSGEADAVCGWLENTLTAPGKAQPFQAFVLQGRAPQMAFGVSMKTLPGLSNLANLRGKKVGIMAPNTPSHTVAHAVLARAGLRWSEMGFVSVGTPSGALAALRSGQIDALCYGDPLMTQLEQGAELRVLADTRSLNGTQLVHGGQMPSTCLYVPQDVVQKLPATLQAATYAMVHALKWLQTAGLSDLMKIVPESYFAGDRALYLAAFTRMREAIALDGLIPPAGVRNALAAMRRADPVLYNEPVDLERSFTNEFAQRAKQRFMA